MEQEPPAAPPPPQPSNPRFTLELEFVLSLANPHYISHLAATYPHLLGISSSGDNSSSGGGDRATESPSARAFAAYLAYLYDYWRRPEYVQFLTHPGATLRALRLLQEESFRTAVIRPQVIEALLATGEAGAAGHQGMAEEKKKKEEEEAEGTGAQ